ncbi:TPR end-of-group domain-containing protein [Dysgonomonas sp.]
MKKVVSLFIISLFSLSVFSQNISKEVEDNLQKLYKDAYSAAKNKDYQRATVIFDSLISYYNHLPSKDKEAVSRFLGPVYYDNACYYSLLNNKEKALDCFEKAIEYKWNNYGHTLQDSDLDNLRNEKRFKEAMLKLKKTGDFLQVLKDAPDYNNDLPKEKIQFTYLDASDPDLVRIRQYFNLDSIAGKGDEISQIKNLMTWVHNRVRHDGNSSNPSPRNTENIVKVCDAENRGVNCRMMATMLNECYLAMGFKSRFITCMPAEYISDCHVINAVYSKTLKKWLWMDPTFNAYVSDEKGNLLSIAEVRERLRTDKPVVLNDDANWNNQSKQTKEYYLDSYMAKNLYWLAAPLHSGYNVETAGTTNGYLNLYPAGYTPDPVRNDYSTTNDKVFWEVY